MRIAHPVNARRKCEPQSDTKQKAKLVVAHQVGGQWKTVILDTADGAPVPVVWSQPPGQYRDVYGKKEIRATKPVMRTPEGAVPTAFKYDPSST